MEIKRLTKLQTRNPAKKPNRPLPIVSNIFGNETLNGLVINMYDMPCKIKNATIAVAIIAHHWVTHGSPVDQNNLFSHEFVLSVVLGALIGGLLL